MVGSSIFQWAILPYGLLFLFLHLGPTLTVAKRASIHSGTHWSFFALEAVLSLGWLLGSPVAWASPIARVALIVHLTLHVGFAIADALAHERMLGFALASRSDRPWAWATSLGGLIIDTLCHAIVVVVVVVSLPMLYVLPIVLLAALGYLLVTQVYRRDAESLPA